MRIFERCMKTPVRYLAAGNGMFVSCHGPFFYKRKWEQTMSAGKAIGRRIVV
jgi:hypothetical protein